MNDGAGLVGKNLKFDVSRRGDELLDQHARVAERGLPFALRALERVIEVGVPIDAMHALAAAAGHRLDQHRVADLVGFLLEKTGVLARTMIARQDRNAGLRHQRLGAVLEAHGADRFGRRTDEHDAGARAILGELRVLRQETVARMDALRPAPAAPR